MQEKLELGQCYYRPSFFNMKVDVFIELDDLKEIPEGTMGLYFHEYIHYLQDISTVYGLMNMSTINYYIQACAHDIFQKKDKKEFEVPILLENIKLPTDIIDYGVSNFNLRKVYMGSSIRDKSRAIDNFNYKIISHEYEESKYIDVVIISFYDFDLAKIRELEFGGVHVCEGMAYLCEQFHYGEILKGAPDYPYLIVQKLAETIFPEILELPILMVALCDISLMTYHPGLTYVKLLTFIKDELMVDKDDYNIDKFYEDCMAYVKGSHPDFDVLAEMVRQQISKNFNADYYENTQNWIDIIFSRITKLRTGIPSFMTDLIRYGEPRTNILFGALLNQVGSPLVIDGDYNGTITLPKGYEPTSVNFNPGIFMAIGQILKIFSSNTPTQCELKGFCEKSAERDANLKIDNNCDVAPWKKAQEDHLCPVGQIWHHWALKDYSPKY